MKPLQKFQRFASWWCAALALMLGAAAIVPSYAAHKKAGAQDRPAPARPDQSNSQDDQTELSVAVYNSNIALIRDVRQLQLPTGEFRLKFMDIAATMNPATVHFRSLT
jgi:hypothetical protein